MTTRDGQVVVVTGGGRGIGAAYVRLFAGQGATVVVNDLDAEAATESAEAVGGIAVSGDASTEQGVADLIAAARATGPIEVFCANAGVARAGLVDAAEFSWTLSWQLNVMAHVRASRLLVPAWLDAGHGTFVATVSAAGLLSIPGAAPYAVSKHAAYAYAEWLSMTYGDQGIAVHAVCPQGVRTQMLEDSGEVGKALLGPSAIEPDAVAAALDVAMGERRFLVLPHPEVAPMYAHRAADPEAWLDGMRRLSSKLPTGPIGEWI